MRILTLAQRNSSHNLFITLLSVAILVACGDIAQAQQKKWKTIEINKDYVQEDLSVLSGQELRDAKARNSEAKKNLNGDRKEMLDFAKGGAQPVNFTKFINEYLIADMTQTDLESLSRLGEKRASFLKSFLNPRGNEDSRGRIIGAILPTFRNIATDENYHPAVRHNAVMLLGQLNAVLKIEWHRSHQRLRHPLNNFFAPFY